MQTLPSIDFCTAIKMAFQNYAKCTGRSRRSEFWYFYLFQFLVYFVFYILIIIISNATVSSREYDPYSGSSSSSASALVSILFIIFYIVLLACICPMISLAVRRLHDTGRSGFYFFVTFIPFVGSFILLYFCCIDSEERPNEYGPSPKYILPVNQPINPAPISPYPQASPYQAPMAQPISPYPQPNPMQPQPYMAPPQGPYPPQTAYPGQGNPYPQ